MRVLSTQGVASVEVGTDLLPDVFHVDILFCPQLGNTNYPIGTDLLMEWVGQRRCVLEPYSGTVEDSDLRVSLIQIFGSLWLSCNWPCIAGIKIR